MMSNVIFRLSIRRLRHVASNQKHLCRQFSSTTNNTTASSENRIINNPHDTHGPYVKPATSSIAESPISKEARDTPLSTVVGAKIPTGNSATASSKPSDITTNATVSSVVGNNTNINNTDSNNDDDDGSSKIRFRSVYVHPLSQIVLEYFQESHHRWVVSKGLDQSLTLHRDGSFELKHISQLHASTSTPTPTRPYLSTVQKKDHRNRNSEPIISAATSATASAKVQKNDQMQPSSSTKGSSGGKAGANKRHQPCEHDQAVATSSTDNNDNIRIWTSYDEQEKKHWLTVRRGLFRQRFLLQDNLLTAWQSNRGSSLQEHLHEAVDDMIEAVDRYGCKHQQHQALSTEQQQQWQQKGHRRFRKR